MVFFMVCWFSLPLLPRKMLIKNHVVCYNFPGLSVSNSTSCSSSNSFSTSSSVLDACLLAVGAMSPLLLRVFKQLLKVLFQQYSAVDFSGVDEGLPEKRYAIFYCEKFRLAFLPRNKTLAGIC